MCVVACTGTGCTGHSHRRLSQFGRGDHSQSRVRGQDDSLPGYREQTQLPDIGAADCGQHEYGSQGTRNACGKLVQGRYDHVVRNDRQVYSVVPLSAISHVRTMQSRNLRHLEIGLQIHKCYRWDATQGCGRQRRDRRPRRTRHPIQRAQRLRH